MPPPLPSELSLPARLLTAWLGQSPRGRFVSVWLLSAVPLVLVLWPVLHDAHYWDAGGCYVAEAQLHRLHGANLDAIRAHLPQYLLRPVFYTGLLSWVMRSIGDSVFVLHTFHLLFCCLLPATLSEITICLGGRVWQAWLAVLLTLMTPIFIGQSGLVQTDLPLTTLLAIAWWGLLAKQPLVFCLFAAFAVWTKESGYFIAAPAAILLWWQASVAEGANHTARGLGWLHRRILAAWPALIPPLALGAWLLLRRFIKGGWMESDHVQALSPISPAAHYHNWLDAGRFATSALMLVALYHAWRDRDEARRPLLLSSGLGFLLLPWLFPSYLPRYMLPSLVFAIPLSAIGFGYIATRQRGRVFVLLASIQALALSGRLTWQDIAHLESSLAYRGLLRLHRDAATRLSAEHPRQVLAGFPASFFLTAAPAMGYLPQPLSVQPATPNDTPEAWCQADWLIEAQDDSVRPAMRALRARGALSLAAQLGPPPRQPGAPFLDKERDQTIRLYRIDCRPAIAAATK